MAATLHSGLNVKALVGGKQYLLLEPLVTDEYTIPLGFVTDFASVPRVLWGIFPPNGKYRNAAVVHDYMYVHAITGVKKNADKLFLKNMKALGVPWWKRQAMYYAVRIGGKGNYNG